MAIDYLDREAREQAQIDYEAAKRAEAAAAAEAEAQAQAEREAAARAEAAARDAALIAQAEQEARELAAVREAARLAREAADAEARAAAEAQARAEAEARNRAAAKAAAQAAEEAARAKAEQEARDRALAEAEEQARIEAAAVKEQARIAREKAAARARAEIEPKPEPPPPLPEKITPQQSYANYRGTGGGLSYASWWDIGRPYYYQPELERRIIGRPPMPIPEPVLISPKPKPEPKIVEVVSDAELLYRNYQKTGGGLSFGDWQGIGSPLYYQPALEPPLPPPSPPEPIVVKEEDVLALYEPTEPRIVTTPAAYKSRLTEDEIAAILTKIESLRGADMSITEKTKAIKIWAMQQPSYGSGTLKRYDALFLIENYYGYQNLVLELEGKDPLPVPGEQPGWVPPGTLVEAEPEPVIEPEPEVTIPAEITGKVEESEMSIGTLAAKDISKELHPELTALIESGAPAIEIWEAAQGVSGSYAASVRDQLASQFRTFAELEGEARVDAARILAILPVGFDKYPQELKDAYAEGDKPFSIAVDAYNLRIQEEAEVTQAEFEAIHIQVTGGEWYKKEDLAELKESDPEQYQAILSSGGSASVKLLMEQREEIKKQTIAEVDAAVADMPPELQRVWEDSGKNVTVLNLAIMKYRADFENTHTEVPGLDAEGNEQWIENKQLEDLKTSSPEIYKALITGGFAAADEVVRTSIREFEATLPNLPKVLQDAYKVGGLDGYNITVNEYNEAIRTARAVFPTAGETYWISEEMAVTARSKEFQERYAELVQPASISDKDYAKIKQFILPSGFDSAGAYATGISTSLVDKFVLATSTQEFRDKVTSGDIVLLPYGQSITKKALEDLPKGAQQIITKSGFVGLEKAQEMTYVDALGGFGYREVTEAELRKLIEDYNTGKQKLIAEGKGSSKELFAELGWDPGTSFVLSGKSSSRLAITLASGPLPVVKAALPEYTVGDLSFTDYALTGVNTVLLATLAVPTAIVGSVAGAWTIKGVSTAGAAVYSVRLSENWADLGPVAKVIGVAGVAAYSLPLLIAIYKGLATVHPKSGEILNLELVKGSLPAKSGLTTAQKATVTSTVKAGVADLQATGASSTKLNILGAKFKLEWVKTGTTSALVPIGKITIPVKADILLEHAIKTATGATGVSTVAVGQTVWKGLKLGDHPLVGTSGGKLVIGTAGIELPHLKEWAIPTIDAQGNVTFEPRSGLETQVLVNKTALEKAGMTSPQAEKFVSDIGKTLSLVKSFYGKKSPDMAPELFTEAIDTFSPEGVKAVLKWAVDNKGVVEYERFYGSFAMRPQLSPKAYKEWVEVYGREPGDIDIMFKEGVTPEQAEEAVRDLVKFIKENSADEPWVNETNPHLIMNTSRSTGTGRHAIDTHFPGEPAIEEAISSSRFADMVYGLKKTSPVVKVDIEGIGKIDVARLSETGVGKTEQVLGWRVDEAGNIVLQPAAHRMKDYPDLYEIFETYKEGSGKEWATELGIKEILSKQEAMASDAGVLSKVQNELRNIQDTASLPSIKSKLLDIQRIINKIKNPETKALVQKELNNIIKELNTSIGKGEKSFAIQAKLGAVNSAIDDILRKYQPRGTDLSWEFKPSPGPSPKVAKSVAPVVSIVSPSLISAYYSIPVGMTSEGSVVSAPYNPEVVKSIAPSLVPSDVSLSAPSAAVSPIIPSIPSILPSGIVSAAPSVPPSVPPSAVPPSLAPSIAVSPPSVVPSAPPSPAVVSPSIAPSVPPGVPSYPPSVPPSVPPSAISYVPSVPPSVPSYPPSVPPSYLPSVPPGVPISPYPYPYPYEPPPPPPVPPPPLLPPPVIVGVEEPAKRKRPIEQGSIAWRQGMYWKYIPPPYNINKPITLKRGEAPQGARVGGRTPAETIQVIGTSRAIVPETVSTDLGVVDAFITARGTQIAFTGKGVKTDVGKRLPSTTKGLSISKEPTFITGKPRVLTPPRKVVRAIVRAKKKPKKRAKKRALRFFELAGVHTHKIGW